MKRYYIDTSCECGRFGDDPNLIEEKEGEYCKVEDVEQLQALTKEFAEGIVNNCDNPSECGGDIHCIHCGAWLECGHTHYDGCLTIKAQQYLDSLKECV